MSASAARYIDAPTLMAVPRRKRKWMLRVMGRPGLSPDAMLTAIAAAHVANRRGDFTADETAAWLAANIRTAEAILTELVSAGGLQ